MDDEDRLATMVAELGRDHRDAIDRLITQILQEMRAQIGRTRSDVAAVMRTMEQLRELRPADVARMERLLYGEDGSYDGLVARINRLHGDVSKISQSMDTLERSIAVLTVQHTALARRTTVISAVAISGVAVLTMLAVVVAVLLTWQ